MDDHTAPIESPREVDISRPVHEVLGALYSLDIVREVGFAASRFYWITNVPKGGLRGRHAHKKLRQFLLVLRGSAVVELRTPEWSAKYFLSAHNTGLYIPPAYWRVMSDFSTDALMCVLASESYDESDYIRDWSEYESWLKTK